MRVFTATLHPAVILGPACSFTLTMLTWSRLHSFTLLPLMLTAQCGQPAAPSPSPSDVAAFQATIQHLVVIIKENRSFDNLFGTFPGADGATSGTISTGQQVSLARALDVMPHDIGHDWDSTHVAIDNGKMDRFDMVAQATGTNGELLGMTQFLGSDLPNYWSYAEHFALADRMFSSLAGPS